MAVLEDQDLAFWEENGYVIIHDAVPKSNLDAMIQTIWDFLEVDGEDPDAWYHHRPRGHSGDSASPISLAGMVEVAAVHGRANATLAAGYGFTGILVAFLARQNPLAIIPVAILMGGIGASGGLLQRRLDLPDATVLVLQGILFVVLLASETLYGRLRLPSLPRRRNAAPAAPAATGKA